MCDYMYKNVQLGWTTGLFLKKSPEGRQNNKTFFQTQTRIDRSKTMFLGNIKKH